MAAGPIERIHWNLHSRLYDRTGATLTQCRTRPLPGLPIVEPTTTGTGRVETKVTSANHRHRAQPREGWVELGSRAVNGGEGPLHSGRDPGHAVDPACPPPVGETPRQVATGSRDGVSGRLWLRGLRERRPSTAERRPPRCGLP